jgi:hypothetical protein
MQSIQAIIAHGDLTDVAFNEKTLDTKFTADPYWEAYSPPNPQILHLSSDQVLGSKIHTEVIVFKAKSQQLKNGFIAGLGFGGPPNFIADCLHIPISHFASFFGGNFSGLPTGEGIPTASETNVLGSPGKNGTHLHVTFDYGFDKNVVTAVSVYQQP